MSRIALLVPVRFEPTNETIHVFEQRFHGSLQARGAVLNTDKAFLMASYNLTKVLGRSQGRLGPSRGRPSAWSSEPDPESERACVFVPLSWRAGLPCVGN